MFFPTKFVNKSINTLWKRSNEYRYLFGTSYAHPFFSSAWSSIKYDDHHTFILSVSWTTGLLPALIWIVLHISFHFDKEHSWSGVSDVILQLSIDTCLDYTVQLPLQAPPHHRMSVYVHLAALDWNGVTCCRSRWASAWPGWWHVQDSCCLWVTKPCKFVD